MSHDVRVVIVVNAAAATAFQVFVEETDLWWRRGVQWRFLRGPRGVLRFEPGVGGRLIEVNGDDDTIAHVVGEITVWEPGARLRFAWRLPNFAPEESTWVELRFDPLDDRRTRVTLEHHGLGALRDGHPARHGQANAAWFASYGRWWAQLLGAWGERAAAR